MATARLDAAGLARALAAPAPRRTVRWVEIDDPADAASLRAVFSGDRRLHPLAERVLRRPGAHAFFEALPEGWTTWSCLLPLPTPGRRVAFGAAISAGLVITTLRADEEDHRPAGGWWRRKEQASDDGGCCSNCCGRKRAAAPAADDDDDDDALRNPLLERARAATAATDDSAPRDSRFRRADLPLTGIAARPRPRRGE